MWTLRLKFFYTWFIYNKVILVQKLKLSVKCLIYCEKWNIFRGNKHFNRAVKHCQVHVFAHSCSLLSKNNPVWTSFLEPFPHLMIETVSRRGQRCPLIIDKRLGGGKGSHRNQSKASWDGYKINWIFYHFDPSKT